MGWGSRGDARLGTLSLIISVFGDSIVWRPRSVLKRGGNKQKAAQALGPSRQGLIKNLKTLGNK